LGKETFKLDQTTVVIFYPYPEVPIKEYEEVSGKFPYFGGGSRGFLLSVQRLVFVV